MSACAHQFKLSFTPGFMRVGVELVQKCTYICVFLFSLSPPLVASGAVQEQKPSDSPAAQAHGGTVFHRRVTRGLAVSRWIMAPQQISSRGKGSGQAQAFIHWYVQP